MSTAAPVASPYNRNNPFSAKLTENRRLNKAGSAKDTRHFIIDLTGSGISYNPGDSLGVIAQNPPALATDLLALLGIDAATPVTDAKLGVLPVAELLTTQYTLNRVGKKFVKAVAEKLPEGAAKTQLSAICADDAQLTEYVFTRDYVDVAKEYPGASFTAEELVGTLSKINPRLYSIASSIAKHPGEVHLTVAVVGYETHGRAKLGLASGYLAEYVPLNSTLPVYIQSSKHFHLPAGDKDIIMVGPGTGIAPFRAFLEQRSVDGSKGRNWLFFGDQKKATDYLYEEEFEAYQKSGLLTRMSTAFSRDQAEKIYVQTRMKESGKELWDWLQGGAYFYVCGDAKRMAKDVHQALIEVAQEHGGLDAAAATAYVETTLAKTEKRYLRDVY